jgi:hypothetical protein
VDQPPLDNQTDFIAHPQLLLDKDGEKLVAMVKATWELPHGSDELELAPVERQRGLRGADIPWGLPGESSTLLPGDFCVRKPGTDVVLVARGYAPQGQPAEHFDVSVRVGSVSKVLRVFGLRVWEASGAGLSSPRPISELDLRYEYAWGGAEFNDAGDGVEEARNPLGLGKVIDNDSLTHQPAPQIEDPFNLITSVSSEPAPAGVGALQRHWEPRRGHCGTYDEKWLDERAPLLPPDEDDRVNHVATPDLIATTPLRAGDPVALAGTLPGGGGVSFALPKVAVEIEFQVKDRQPEVLRPYLDTVVIDQLFGAGGSLPTVELVWRAAIVAPRRMKDAQVIVRETAVK